MPGEYSPRAVAAGGGTDVDTAAMPPDGPAAQAHRGAWRDPVTWALAALVFCAYFVISLFRLLRLDPGSYDLAIYTEYVKQLSQLHAPVVDVLGPGYNLLGDHFQVAVGLLAPFFRVVPSPATLLFFQALLTAVSVFPVVGAGFALSGKATGRLIGFAYGFSWGLQQMVDFDFHEVALAVPLLAFSLSALVRRRPVAAICWAAPLVFVKEDQGFTVAVIGLLLATAAVYPGLLPGPVAAARLSSRGDGRRLDGGAGVAAGLCLTAWGLFWSVFAIAVIIPHFNPGHVYSFWKDGGVVGGGRSFSVTAVLSQLGDGWQVKLETVVLLLLPTAFTALGSPVALIALPILALRFVSVNTAYWGIDWHYNATVMPVLFIAAADAIGRWQRAPAFAWPSRGDPGAPGLARAGLARAGLARHGPAMMAAATAALAFQFPVSNLWQASTYRLDAHVAAADAAMAVVPDGVTVQTNLDLLAPLAARTDTFWIGTPGNPLTQYVVFDNDDSGYGTTITNVTAFIAMLYPHDGYVLVFERDGVYVFRRLPPPRHHCSLRHRRSPRHRRSWPRTSARGPPHRRPDTGKNLYRELVKNLSDLIRFVPSKVSISCERTPGATGRVYQRSQGFLAVHEGRRYEGRVCLRLGLREW